MVEVLNTSGVPHRYEHRQADVPTRVTYVWGPGEVQDVPENVARVVTTHHAEKMVYTRSAANRMMDTSGATSSRAGRHYHYYRVDDNICHSKLPDGTVCGRQKRGTAPPAAPAAQVGAGDQDAGPADHSEEEEADPS